MHNGASRGFTLMETLVAIFIFSLTIAFVTVVAQTVKMSRDSFFKGIAANIAANKLDALRAAGYASLPASGSFTDPELSSLPNGSASTSITAWNSQTDEVAASVSWTNSSGGTSDVALTTLITKTGGL